MTTVTIQPVPGIPDIRPGDDLGQIIGDCLAAMGEVEPGDVLAVAHKVISKAEGNVVALADVTPSDEALDLGRELHKNPAKVEVVLQQSNRVLRAFKRPDQAEGTLICEHRLGFISANAAVDESNVGARDTVITLPVDPDASARRLGRALEKRFGKPIGIVVTDTFGRPWRLGQVNVAIGLYGVPARRSEAGELDAWGRPLTVTEPAFSDEIAAASGLAMHKAAKTPVILFRGLQWEAEAETSARNLLRAKEEDVFQ
ncbi:MAG: coenzyme F420-0:L-glutamate ligase [Pseudomonadota bacterium]